MRNFTNLHVNLYEKFGKLSQEIRVFVRHGVLPYLEFYVRLRLLIANLSQILWPLSRALGSPSSQYAPNQPRIVCCVNSVSRVDEKETSF